MDVRHGARHVVFVLRGKLDFDSTVQLREAGERESARGAGAVGPVVADCAALEFCDSSGISALVRLHQRLAEAGRALRLASVPGSVARLFSLTGLDQVFSVYADVPAALAGGAGPRGPARSSEGQPV
ncbi:STAS domain-containing protein [Streptomyces lichenis]|uniref:Anti-sigma factor antagonist n=1 Tax=Streptomyces lichenis TaxID=2306967 RepID=A0ABT0IAG9_9ACTN|nr:STAS domain-containing protein [Streptomyces lichenis]MCK8678316.1 STAS domain-containing protein [Streptomyces lichenis]